MQFVFRRLLFATTNEGKLREAKEVLPEGQMEVLSTSEIQSIHDLSPPPLVDETSSSYEGNAKLKAEAHFIWSGSVATLADDSGLEVEALGGMPGVNTARYAGINASSKDNIDKLLKEMSTSKNRRAKFVCCLYLILPGNSIHIERAEFKGSIASDPYGSGGFGYDPVFIPDGYAESLAELKGKGMEVPTHRVMALEKMFGKLKIEV